MKQFDYEGVDKNGRTVRGTTAGVSLKAVKAQLKEFGFGKIHVEEKDASEARRRAPREEQETLADDFVQQLVDGDIEVEARAPADEEEEAEGGEWRRLEVLERVRKYRYRENIIILVMLIVLVSFAAYFIYDKMTNIPAPQPKIIMRSGSEMLSFKDVYVKGSDIVFIVFARNWNGNVRVDFKAWDPFENVVDFGTARLGFIGDHYGGSPEKSGTFKLKKTRYYETIEIRVNGDEGK